MSDADGRTIPLVEGDQGEGIKDFIDSNEELLRKLGEQNLKEVLEKGKTENEVLRDILERIRTMENFLRHTFDGHVLINGQFRKIL